MSLEKGEKLMMLSLSLLSKNVINGSEFLDNFISIFVDKNQSRRKNFMLFLQEKKYLIIENLFRKLSQIEISKSMEKMILNNFETHEDNEIWELICKIKVLNISSLVYVNQKSEILELLENLVKLCVLHDQYEIKELTILFDTLKESIEIFGEEFEQNFDEIWGLITKYILFGKFTESDLEHKESSINTPKINFHSINYKAVKVTFELISSILLKIPNKQNFIFEQLQKFVIMTENPKLFITQKSLKMNSFITEFERKNYGEEGCRKLEDLIMSNFWKFINQREDSFSLSSNQFKNNQKIIVNEEFSVSDKISCGLINLCCTCYFNSLIQQFVNMDWFSNFILKSCSQLSKRIPIDIINKDNRKEEYLKELGSLIYSIFMNKKSRFLPIDFLESFEDMNFKVQRDVYEFFNEFLNNLEDSLVYHEIPAQPLNENLKGEFTNQTKFIGCGHTIISNKEEFIVLSLEIKEMTDIHNSLKYFSEWELLQTDPAECPKCHQKSERERRTLISKLPNQFIIQLKRFQFEKGQFVKLNNGFHFSEKLEIEVHSDILNNVVKKESFELNGVILHSGSVRSGHYMSLVKKDSNTFDERNYQDGIMEHSPDIQNSLKNFIEFNFRKKNHERELKKLNEQSQWILYNDDNVSFYDEKNIPEDCFGVFKDPKQYSISFFKEESKLVISQRENKDHNKFQLSKDKRNLLNDLGSFEEEEEKTKSNQIDFSEIKLSSKKNQNAYMLFYIKENQKISKSNSFDDEEEEEEEEHSDKTSQISEVKNFEQSPFGQTVLKDLDTEFMMDTRFTVLSNDVGQEFIFGLFENFLNSYIISPSESKLESVCQSFSLTAKYFFQFLCKYNLEENGKRGLNSIGEMMCNSMTVNHLSDIELKLKSKQSEVEGLSVQQRAQLVFQFALIILEMTIQSCVESNSSNNDKNIIMNIISSRDNLYGSDGSFIRNKTVSFGKYTYLKKSIWVMEILLQAVSNMNQAFTIMDWHQKRIYFNFIKLILKFLMIYQLNSSNLIFILLEMLENPNLIVYLNKLGLPAVIYNIYPEIFESMQKNSINGWINIFSYFDNFDQITSIDMKNSKRMIDYLMNSFESQNHIKTSQYINFRKNYLVNKETIENERVKFGNNSEKILTRMKKEYLALMLKLSLKYFQQVLPHKTFIEYFSNYCLNSKDRLKWLLKIANVKINLCQELGSIVSQSTSSNVIFNLLMKTVLTNSNVFGLLSLLSGFVQLEDTKTKTRHQQILFYFSKLFNYNDFMNYFLIDLVIRWIIEVCSTNQDFLMVLIKENREVLEIMAEFNKKIKSIESIQVNGIIFSIENLGVFEILENTLKNDIVNKFLLTKYKERAKYLVKINKKDSFTLSHKVFNNSSHMKEFLCNGLSGKFKEESFYEVDFQIVKKFRINILIKITSLRNSRSKEKVLVLPFDHPCLFYPVQ